MTTVPSVIPIRHQTPPNHTSVSPALHSASDTPSTGASTQAPPSASLTITGVFPPPIVARAAPAGPPSPPSHAPGLPPARFLLKTTSRCEEGPASTSASHVA